MGSLSDNYIINNKEILLDIMIQLITLNSCNFSIRFMPKEGCHFFMAWQCGRPRSLPLLLLSPVHLDSVLPQFCPPIFIWATILFLLSSDRRFPEIRSRVSSRNYCDSQISSLPSEFWRDLAAIRQIRPVGMFLFCGVLDAEGREEDLAPGT